MVSLVTHQDTIDLFQQLAHIEDLHKDRIFNEYQRFCDNEDRSEFEERVHKGSLEGGLSTEDYINWFQPDLENVVDVISLAMSIEAQALDLYSRGAQYATDFTNKEILMKIAAEEKQHLEKLGNLLEKTTEGSHG